MVRMAKLLLYLILFKFHLVLMKKDAHKPEQQLHQGTLRELHNMTETFSNEECPPLSTISLLHTAGTSISPLSLAVLHLMK